MYKREHIEAAAFFMEKCVLGTCMSDSEVILDFIEAMPEIAAEFGSDEEIFDLLNSQ